MSEETKSERSKKCPSMPLSTAIDLAKKLYQKAGKTKIKVEVALNALGYSGVNGAALTTLGALSQYGLVDRDKGSMVSISPVAIRVFHPLNEEQKVKSLEELALNPKVFNELYTNGFQGAEDDVIANHLIQNGFTPDKAKKVAVVFKENIDLANLGVNGIKCENDSNASEKTNFTLEGGPPDLVAEFEARTAGNEKQGTKKMLAQYSIPLGANEATITFIGEKLSAADFDALRDYVDIFKKQFERKTAASIDSNLEKIWGTISTQAKKIDNRINFLLALNDGNVFTCLSGAGTNFDVSQFVNGQHITLIGQRVRDLINGSLTPMFIFREAEE